MSASETFSVVTAITVLVFGILIISQVSEDRLQSKVKKAILLTRCPMCRYSLPTATENDFWRVSVMLDPIPGATIQDIDVPEFRIKCPGCSKALYYTEKGKFVNWATAKQAGDIQSNPS